jgi:C-terminal processing protease CtpA/Prc
MSFVADTDALIVDLRRNGGGDPAMVAYVLSYLFDTRTHLNDLRYGRGDRLEQFWTAPVPGQVFGGTKPVFVLTSRETFSGAEDFAYALKILKRARIVGETTGGGAHPAREFKVSEHFTVAVPYARSVSPITNANWEGTGVVPDIAVPADDALRVAYRAAVEGLRDATQDAGRKQALQDVLDHAKDTNAAKQ